MIKKAEDADGLSAHQGRERILARFRPEILSDFNRILVLPRQTGKLEFGRRAGGQVVAGSAGGQSVTDLVYDRSTFGYRSVSFYGSINWNLSNSSVNWFICWKSIFLFSVLILHQG